MEATGARNWSENCCRCNRCLNTETAVQCTNSHKLHLEPYNDDYGKLFLHKITRQDLYQQHGSNCN